MEGEIEVDEKQRELLEKQNSRLVSKFDAFSFERDACKNWDKFYKRNTTKFFKDRHWTEREFNELDARNWPNEHYVILESGCGVGNFVFPILEQYNNIDAYACDFSPRAVEFVKTRSEENGLSHRLTAFQCDLTQNIMKLEQEMDLVTMIFVLSAVHPDKFIIVLRNLASKMKSNGKILFRDYAINDHAMIRFKSGSKIQERMYVRQDGTRTYFFTIEELTALANDAGLEIEKIEYCQRKTVNKKEDVDVKRLFLQAVLLKK